MSSKIKANTIFWIQFIFWILVLLFVSIGCTRKQITTSTDRKEIVTVNSRIIPPVRAHFATSMDTLTYFKVFHTTDTVKVTQTRFITATDTIYETVVDCPDIVDTTRVVNEKVTNTVTREKTFFGKVKEFIWTALMIALIVGAALVGIKFIWKYSGPG